MSTLIFLGSVVYLAVALAISLAWFGHFERKSFGVAYWGTFAWLTILCGLPLTIAYDLGYLK